MRLNEQRQPVHAAHGTRLAPCADTAGVAATKPSRLLRLPAVEDRTGLKKSTWYAAVKSGDAPAPVHLSARAVAWREEDVDQWISGRTTTKMVQP